MATNTPTRLLSSVAPISNIIKQHGGLLMALRERSAALSQSKIKNDQLRQKVSEVEQERDWLTALLSPTGSPLGAVEAQADNSMFQETRSVYDDLLDITILSFQNLQVDPKRLDYMKEMKRRYLSKMDEVRAKLDKAQGEGLGSDRKKIISQCRLSMQVFDHYIQRITLEIRRCKAMPASERDETVDQLRALNQLCVKQNQDFIAANRIIALLMKMLFEERALRIKETGKLMQKNEALAFKLSTKNGVISHQAHRIRQLEQEVRTLSGHSRSVPTSDQSSQPIGDEEDVSFSDLLFQPEESQTGSNSTSKSVVITPLDFDHPVEERLRDHEIVRQNILSQLSQQ